MRLLITLLLAAAVPAAATETTAPKPKAEAEEDGPKLPADRYFNRTGSTWADYKTDWQDCRIIARGSQVPGQSTYIYVPASYSPIAAGVGAGLGAAIAVAIIEGQMRRANRATCLLIRGWREMKLSPAEVAMLAKLPVAERDSRIAEATGSAQPALGSVVHAWHNDYAELQIDGAAR